MYKPELIINKDFLTKYKKSILISLAIIIVMIILVIPIIPVQCTVTKTRTREFRYGSKLIERIERFGDYNFSVCAWQSTTWQHIPLGVSVTNNDLVGGEFSVTMTRWHLHIDQPKQLGVNFSQSLHIKAGATQRLYVPEHWINFVCDFACVPYSFTYSVSAPSKEEAYNVTQMEYKSILNLIVAF